MTNINFEILLGNISFILLFGIMIFYWLEVNFSFFLKFHFIAFSATILSNFIRAQFIVILFVAQIASTTLHFSYFDITIMRHNFVWTLIQAALPALNELQKLWTNLIESTEKVSLAQQVRGVSNFGLVEVAKRNLTKTVLAFRTRSMEHRAV